MIHGRPLQLFALAFMPLDNHYLALLPKMLKSMVASDRSSGPLWKL